MPPTEPPLNTESNLITPLLSKFLFSGHCVPYGLFLDVSIKKLLVKQRERVQSGYGFIHFPQTVEGIQSALTPVHFVHKMTIDGVYFESEITHRLRTEVLKLQKYRPDLHFEYFECYHPSASSLSPRYRQADLFAEGFYHTQQNSSSSRSVFSTLGRVHHTSAFPSGQPGNYIESFLAGPNSSSQMMEIPREGVRNDLRSSSIFFD